MADVRKLSDAELLKMLQDHPAMAEQPQASADEGGSTIADVVRSIPGGIAKGLAGIAGLPGDVNNLLDAAANKARSLISPDAVPVSTKTPISLPTTEDISTKIAGPFGGFYLPRTTPGKYAETIGMFAPNMLTPGTLPQKIARTVLPGAVSETAGELTQGTSAEPVARFLGGLAGSGGARAIESRAAKAKNPAPTAQELSQQKTAAYKAADDAGAVISPDAWNRFATDLGTSITKDGVIHPDLHPNTLTALGIIQDETASGQPITLKRAEIVRRAVNGAIDKASGATGNNSDLAETLNVRNKLDQFLGDLQPEDTLAGNSKEGVAAFKQGRALASREFKSEAIQKLIDLAENAADTNYSQAGLEQALRVQFKNLNADLIRNKNYANTFTPEERQAIEAVSKGGPISNGLRMVGKWSLNGPITGGMGAIVGTGTGLATSSPAVGVAAALGVPALGGLARVAATKATQARAQNALDIMRRGPLPQLPTPATTGMLPLDIFLPRRAAQ